MDEAILSSDRSVSDVRDLSARQQGLQTSFIMNENRVNSARDAAVAAKDLVQMQIDHLVSFENLASQFVRRRAAQMRSSTNLTPSSRMLAQVSR